MGQHHSAFVTASAVRMAARTYIFLFTYLLTYLLTIQLGLFSGTDRTPDYAWLAFRKNFGPLHHYSWEMWITVNTV